MSCRHVTTCSRHFQLSFSPTIIMNTNCNGAFLKASSHASSAAVCDFSTVLNGSISVTVIGQAIVRSSLAKLSQCECKCHFPSRGGLHRSSNGVSLTASLSFPPLCHVDKSNLLPQEEPMLLPLPIWTNSKVLFLIIILPTIGLLTNVIRFPSSANF